MFLIGFIFVALISWLYISSNSTASALVTKINFNYDDLFAKSLSEGDFVLGMVFDPLLKLA